MPEFSPFDLHIHTTYSSDGQYSVGELIGRMRDGGYGLFSLTDHNRIDAAREVSADFADDSGAMTFVSGIELSTHFGEQEVHLLAYGIAPDSAALGEALSIYRTQRVKQAEARTERIIDLGYRVTFDEVMAEAGGSGASGVSFIRALKKHPENHALLEPYLTGDKSDSPYTKFYFDHFFKGGTAYVHVPFIDFTHAVSILRDEALLVVAHPGLYRHLIDELLIDGVSGVEVCSTYHDDEARAFFRARAENAGCIMTAGSDYHGPDIKPDVTLGGHGCQDARVKEMFVERLQTFNATTLQV